MKTLQPALFILLLSLICSGLQAQKRCATVEYQKLNRALGKVFETDEQFEKALAEKISARKKNQFKNLSPGATYKIPVVVHIIHNGEQLGDDRNITDEQVISQIEVLNKDFNRLNADAGNTPAEFLSVAGNLNIEFVLAKQDPNGNCTNGIVRVNGNRASWSINRETEFKALSYWPAEDYLNIWVIRFSGYLGYAQFPVSSGLDGLEENGTELTDGVILDHRVFGSSDAGDFDLLDDYNKGRSATHEIGHFLGLRHIWGDDNGCSATDYADDTPNQGEETYSPPVHPFSDGCSSAIMFQNFMDYTDDVAMNLFTLDQIERMVTVLENSPRRNSLSLSHGLSEPSQTPVDLAITNTDLPLTLICAETRSDKTPLTVMVENIGSTQPEDIVYTLSVNNNPIDSHDIQLDFTNDVAQFTVTSFLDLIVGNNTLKIGVWSGCDPSPSNNEVILPVTLLGTECVPFLLYMQDDGQSSITFDLSETTYARITVVTPMGQEVTSLALQEASNQTIPFSIKPGIYIVRVQVGPRYYTRKVYLQP